VRRIEDWLRDLGLAEYAPRFAENDIDWAILGDLTDQDLEKIGVGSLGHRRRLLKAIAELGKGSDSSAPISARPVSITVEASAERRQLTVMFCDLVGSTALSARLDPEDMRAIIASYHTAVAGAVRNQDGFVAKYMGDGVLAYFGYPRAHEDDAERAVQAGLAIVEEAPRLENSSGETLHVRVGVATGIVVVGDLVGSGESSERGVVGDTPNLAARLQGFAKPDSVVIAEATRRLIGNLFELEDLDAQGLKGVPGATRAFRVLRPRSVESRFEAMHGRALTPLVGREEELELLLRQWARAKAGEGQVVLLSGEPGIGKSRLTAALMERLVAEPHVRLRYFCSPQRVDSALYPIIAHLERAARFSREDDLPSKLDKLDGLLAQSETSPEDAGLLADMLSLANDARYPKAELTPQQRRDNTLTALVRQIEALSRKSPTLMIFEDAHWADPSSVETLGRLIDRMERLNVLLVVAHRPEFAPPWIGRSIVTTLTVDRLGRRDIDLMITGIAGNRSLPDAIRLDIAERADGVPLFAEEIAKAAIEAADDSGIERTIAAIPSAVHSVPATLHASLLARLDRLGEAKEVAQVGAAIGREFGHELLAAVAEKSEIDVTSALDRLVQAGLVFQQGAPPDATYLFKHALVQDTAYGTLLREQRRALHARIAEVLESRAGVAERQAELLARHCTEAGLIEKAANLWGRAGQQSLARSALVEAETQLTRALTQIATLPETPTLRREQIKFQIGRANAQMQTKGYAARDTKESLEQARTLIERAEALAEPAEDPLALFSVLNGFWLTNQVAFNGNALLELASEFLAIAEKQNATAPLMIGHRLVGTSSVLTGKVVEGRAHLDHAIALYVPGEHRSLATRFASDTRINILASRSLALNVLGYRDAARADADYALEDAREFGHVPTMLVALFWGSLTHIQRRDHASANSQLSELVALADEKGAPFWKALGRAVQDVSAPAGQSLNAVVSIDSSIAAYRATGSSIWLPLCLSSLARAYAQVDRFDDARRCIGEAMAAMEATGEKWNEADIHRIAGDIELLSPGREATKAQGLFERALAIARAQQARSWELRAATSMARLWRDQGKRNEARDLLAPVYGWFTEGFHTLDLKDAKALLTELA
jgi:class 3 adenylate cyclase/predicted ATPase